MYIVKMYDEEEMIKGYLTDDSEFGVRSEAAEFNSEDEAQEAIDEFLDEYSEYSYSYKIKRI
ncbi:hypothetical protein [Pseudobutyrivibrio sp.]|uniref:hypothetical protein n=1 Tax=Pseudobutyrivibrio sp. TaxID=2014367 RepID=UPI001D2ED037|nr:hypothetical protein [Pseudobutyrivibrio sp.]MBE5911944.1 hypothetical protein [Pseudobutyrivibrio sp.]